MKFNLNHVGSSGPGDSSESGCVIILLIGLMLLIMTGCAVLERYQAPYSGAELESYETTK
jgi:hypothetical protein